MLIGIVFGSYYAIQSKAGEPVTLWTQVRRAVQTAAETRQIWGLGLGVSLKKTGHSEIDGFEQLEKPGGKFRGFADVGPLDLLIFFLLFLVPKKSWWFSAAKCRCLLSPVSERYYREKIHLTAISPHTHMYNIHFRQSKKPMTMISQFITSSRIRVFTPHIFNFKIIFESSVWINDSNRIPLHSLKLAVVAPEKIPGPNRKEPELPIIIFPGLCSGGGGVSLSNPAACRNYMSLWSLIVALEDDDYPAHPQKTVTATGWNFCPKKAGHSVHKRPLRLQMTEVCTRKMSESE